MKISALILFVFCTLFAGAQTSRNDTLINGIRVVFRYSSSIFPSSWSAEPIRARGIAINPGEISRSKKVLKTALDKYPASLLKKELRAVYFLKDMYFYSIGYGGTNSRDAVYLCNNGTADGYTDRYIEQSFHHEFSSILYRNHPGYFNETAWRAANSPGTDYNDPENGVGAIRNNESSQELDSALCARGFLTQYALSGIENDLNTVAQNLFAPSEGFWEKVQKYPGIRTKVNLLIGFYQRLNPVYTESYFKKFNR